MELGLGTGEGTDEVPPDAATGFARSAEFGV